MAVDHLYLGLNRGADPSPDNVTIGTTTTGKDVEVFIRATSQLGGLTRNEIGVMLTAIERRINDGRFTTTTL